MKSNDLVNETPIIKEAIRRLHPREQELRLRRLKIAGDCVLKGIEALPKEQWIKPEDDNPYLLDIANEVSREKQLREAYRTN